VVDGRVADAWVVEIGDQVDVRVAQRDG
jgi:hypothetical protein